MEETKVKKSVTDPEEGPEGGTAKDQDELNTEPKEGEAALLESETRFRDLVELLPQAVFETDEMGKLTLTNARGLETFGYTREDFDKGASIFRLVASEDRMKARENNRRVMRGERLNGIEYVMEKKNGSRFPAVVYSSPITRQHKIVGTRGIIVDISERKRAEEALLIERERLETVTQNIGAGLAIISKDYQTLWANKVLKDLFGDVEGEVCHLAYNERNEICPGCGVREIFEKGKDKVVHEQLGRDILGNKIWSEIIATPIKDKRGNIASALELVIPITERKRAEEERASLQEQFLQSQKMESIGRLAGGIAHDFNNLLTVIEGYTQLSLIGLKEGDPLKKNLEQVQNAAEHATGLTRQILAFSRRQILDMKVLDLNIILRDLEKMLQRVIGEDIELVTVLAKNLGKVKADSSQIEQVIMNLAVNARDAMPNGGKLTIETANEELDESYARRHIAVKPGRYVMLAVSDTGCGMSPEIRDRVFEPFFTTKDKGKGTGLGLSTVYGIVKQSGGNIWVYSEPGLGTTFKIYLPVVDEPMIEEPKERPIAERARGGETILVVEDDENLRRLTSLILKKHGYRILEASNGGEALIICRNIKEPLDLVLTDVIMPGMSGRQLIEELRQIRDAFKVLYMSGYTDNAIVHHGVLDAGIDLIQKPFTIAGLLRKVREVMDN